MIKSYVYMILAAVCLGTIGVLVKLIDGSVPVMTLNFLRVFVGFLFLLAVVPFMDKHAFRLSRNDAKSFFMIGVIFAIALSLYTSANLFAPVQNVVLLNYIYPFFVLFFAALLLKEKITSTKIITLIIAFVGLIIINPFSQGDHTLGNLLSLTGAIFYALLITEMRKVDKNHSIGDVLWFLLFASLVLLPFALFFGFGNIQEALWYIIALGVVSTGLAYLLYNLALEKLEAEVCSILATIVNPLVSIVLAVLIVSEEVHIRTILGGAVLICAGIYLEMHTKNLD